MFTKTERRRYEDDELDPLMPIRSEKLHIVRRVRIVKSVLAVRFPGEVHFQYD